MSYTGQKNKFQERHGEGHYQFENTFFRFHGSYLHNLKEGYGVLEMGDGSSIEGDFQRGEISGKGLRRYPNGSTYQGEFLDGERFGYGVFYGSFNLETLKGNWMFNRLNGEATCVLRNQDQIDGTYKNHLLHGDNISYIFQNGKARYEGAFRDGHFHGEGLFEASRSWDEEISNHSRLPAGTSLPETSILKRLFWKRVYQPIFESYSGEWKEGKKDGNGVLEVRFLSRRQVEENDADVPFVLRVEGAWKNDCPLEIVSHIVVFDPLQNSKWCIQEMASLLAPSASHSDGGDCGAGSGSGPETKSSRPASTSSNIDRIDSEESEEAEEVADESPEMQPRIVVPEPKGITIPQYTVKLSSPSLKLVLILARKETSLELPTTDATQAKKGKEPAQTPTPVEITKFVQVNNETGRVISCRLFKIPDAFVKKKPAKGEVLEEISYSHLPSEKEPMQRVEGIPHIIQIDQSNNSALPGNATEVTFNFSKVPIGYYALRFSNVAMTLGPTEIDNHVVYVQVLK